MNGLDKARGIKALRWNSLCCFSTKDCRIYKLLFSRPFIRSNMSEKTVSSMTTGTRTSTIEVFEARTSPYNKNAPRQQAGLNPQQGVFAQGEGTAFDALHSSI